MKKIISATVLVLFLLTVVGGQYFLFKAYRTHVRAQAKLALKAMAREDAEVLAFSKKDFENGLPYTIVPDKNDEIIFEGEYFDVKDTRTTKDSIFLYAYRDTREKLLVQQFEKQTRENDTGPAATLLHQFNSLFVCIPNSCTSIQHHSDGQKFIFITFNNQYQLNENGIDSPPPRCA